MIFYFLQNLSIMFKPNRFSKKHYLLVLLTLFCGLAFGQKRFKEHEDDTPVNPERHKGKAILLHLTYGMQMPGGDLKDRFGWNNTVGGGIEFIARNNVFFGAEGHYLFGLRVNEDPLVPIRTDSGYIVGNNISC